VQRAIEGQKALEGAEGHRAVEGCIEDNGLKRGQRDEERTEGCRGDREP
jgi:hypothetical protein